MKYLMERFNYSLVWCNKARNNETRLRVLTQESKNPHQVNCMAVLDSELGGKIRLPMHFLDRWCPSGVLVDKN